MSATEDMGTDDVRNDDVRNDNIGTDDVRTDDVRNDNIGTDGAESDDMTTARAVRAMLLLMPRLVGRAKRLPVPAALRGLDLASRHLALLAHLQYDGPLTVSQLADRLEVAPTTVSLMVGDLSRRGLLTRQEDDADRRRKIVAIAPDFAAPVTQWLSGSAAAWTEVLAALTPAERATVVGTMRAYEAALEKQTGALPRLRPRLFARSVTTWDASARPPTRHSAHKGRDHGRQACRVSGHGRQAPKVGNRGRQACETDGDEGAGREVRQRVIGYP